jgi:hypothetical protein
LFDADAVVVLAEEDLWRRVMNVVVAVGRMARVAEALERGAIDRVRKAMVAVVCGM